MTYDFMTMLVTGLTLGFSAGISPGPFLALTISETLKHGTKTGLKVAIVPLLTDAPVIIGSVFLLTKLSDLTNLFAVISIVGAMFLVYFGIENLLTKPRGNYEKTSKFSSVKKAIITNYLNPNPYIFWITIGGPLLVGALDLSTWNGMVFLFTFYLMLVGSKMIIVVIGGKASSIFKSEKYLYLIRGAGVMLLIIAVLLFINGIEKLQF